jgi:hypothetical protein
MGPTSVAGTTTAAGVARRTLSRQTGRAMRSSARRRRAVWARGTTTEPLDGGALT